MPAPVPAIYQLKVTLQGIDPPIWRRFQVRSDETFYRLH
ncbi:MAG: plasmid pRiA4b ORF-3 family protein, partial [Chloroflexi bacterium]|nr:plasmid pRiA4b ORF-3 family protein [Chloroflexota bacterium]